MVDEKFLVIDTETTNSLDDPICYDVGFAVVDKEGKVYETHSYAVSDVILDDELMNSAYYVNKIPSYWKEIENNERKLKSFKEIKARVAKTLKKYEITKVVAHNARFDYRSLNLTQRFITSSKFRYFFPFGVKIWDTLKMSKEVLKGSDTYRKFCIDNGYITKNKQNRFTAEVLYRYLTNDTSFIEEHKGLQDVLIEKDIFAYCIKEYPQINGALWDD